MRCVAICVCKHTCAVYMCLQAPSTPGDEVTEGSGPLLRVSQGGWGVLWDLNESLHWVLTVMGREPICNLNGCDSQ